MNSNQNISLLETAGWVDDHHEAESLTIMAECSIAIPLSSIIRLTSLSLSCVISSLSPSSFTMTALFNLSFPLSLSFEQLHFQFTPSPSPPSSSSLSLSPTDACTSVPSTNSSPSLLRKISVASSPSPSLSPTPTPSSSAPSSSSSPFSPSLIADFPSNILIRIVCPSSLKFTPLSSSSSSNDPLAAQSLSTVLSVPSSPLSTSSPPSPITFSHHFSSHFIKIFSGEMLDSLCNEIFTIEILSYSIIPTLPLPSPTPSKSTMGLSTLSSTASSTQTKSSSSSPPSRLISSFTFTLHSLFSRSLSLSSSSTPLSLPLHRKYSLVSSKGAKINVEFEAKVEKSNVNVDIQSHRNHPNNTVLPTPIMDCVYNNRITTHLKRINRLAVDSPFSQRAIDNMTIVKSIKYHDKEHHSSHIHSSSSHSSPTPFPVSILNSYLSSIDEGTSNSNFPWDVEMLHLSLSLPDDVRTFEFTLFTHQSSDMMNGNVKESASSNNAAAATPSSHATNSSVTGNASSSTPSGDFSSIDFTSSSTPPILSSFLSPTTTHSLLSSLLSPSPYHPHPFTIHSHWARIRHPVMEFNEKDVAKMSKNFGVGAGDLMSVNYHVVERQWGVEWGKMTGAEGEGDSCDNHMDNNNNLQFTIQFTLSSTSSPLYRFTNHNKSIERKMSSEDCQSIVEFSIQMENPIMERTKMINIMDIIKGNEERMKKSTVSQSPPSLSSPSSFPSSSPPLPSSFSPLSVFSSIPPSSFSTFSSSFFPPPPHLHLHNAVIDCVNTTMNHDSQKGKMGQQGSNVRINYHNGMIPSTPYSSLPLTAPTLFSLSSLHCHFLNHFPLSTQHFAHSLSMAINQFSTSPLSLSSSSTVESSTAISYSLVGMISYHNLSVNYIRMGRGEEGLAVVEMGIEKMRTIIQTLKGKLANPNDHTHNNNICKVEDHLILLSFLRMSFLLDRCLQSSPSAPSSPTLPVLLQWLNTVESEGNAIEATLNQRRSIDDNPDTLSDNTLLCYLMLMGSRVLLYHCKQTFDERDKELNALLAAFSSKQIPSSPSSSSIFLSLLSLWESANETFFSPTPSPTILLSDIYNRWGCHAASTHINDIMVQQIHGSGIDVDDENPESLYPYVKYLRSASVMRWKRKIIWENISEEEREKEKGKGKGSESERKKHFYKAEKKEMERETIGLGNPLDDERNPYREEKMKEHYEIQEQYYNQNDREENENEDENINKEDGNIDINESDQSDKLPVPLPPLLNGYLNDLIDEEKCHHDYTEYSRSVLKDFLNTSPSLLSYVEEWKIRKSLFVLRGMGWNLDGKNGNVNEEEKGITEDAYDDMILYVCGVLKLYSLIGHHGDRITYMEFDWLPLALTLKSSSSTPSPSLISLLLHYLHQGKTLGKIRGSPHWNHNTFIHTFWEKYQNFYQPL